MARIQFEIRQKDGVFRYQPTLPPVSSFSPPYNYENKSTSSPDFGRISPVILWSIVILAVIFFLSALLHLLVRFLLKTPSFSPVFNSNRYPETSGSISIQRQLQQLFRLHDSGLDQASIDALPVFYYKDITGQKEPSFDCAVCLSEFSDQQKLRLLPSCSHAFHIDCIDTWLLSNSTCPLCRGTLSSSGPCMELPWFDIDISRELSNGVSAERESQLSSGKKLVDKEDDMVSKRVFSVRLGKFRSINDREHEKKWQGESSQLDARRCYSLGSYQYVVGDLSLQVALSPDSSGKDVKLMKGKGVHGCSSDYECKRINGKSKGESLSVSKIWLWPKKTRTLISSNTQIGSTPSTSSLPVSLPNNDTTQIALDAG